MGKIMTPFSCRRTIMGTNRQETHPPPPTTTTFRLRLTSRSTGMYSLQEWSHLLVLWTTEQRYCLQLTQCWMFYWGICSVIRLDLSFLSEWQKEKRLPAVFFFFFGEMCKNNDERFKIEENLSPWIGLQKVSHTGPRDVMQMLTWKGFFFLPS